MVWEMGQIGKNVFGSRLAESRRSRAYTQEELAVRLGVTPQAVSKWERGASFPDLELLADICELVGTSADYLLGIGSQGMMENGDERAQEKILENLRGTLEPLTLIFGEEVVPVFIDDSFREKIAERRGRLSQEGFLMPRVRLMDDLRLQPKEFMILAYDNVLYQERLEEVTAEKLDYIMEKLEETVRGRYDEILNADIIRQLVENLKLRYPAMIQGVVPEKISYGLLLDVTRVFLKRGNSPRYLLRIIEIMERQLRESGSCSAEELAEQVGRKLEREDNLSVYLYMRSAGG